LGKIKSGSYSCRFNGEESMYSASEINYVAIAPQQMLSISSGLIPFVESNDGHRAEMGTHMMCQSLPLIRTYAPAVGTGSEYKIAHDSKRCVTALEDGEVTYVDSKTISIGKKEYPLTKFTRSNQGACLNHTPIVSVGQKVKEGEIIADGSAMNNGELSLGQNLLVAFTA
jgi:DNA-directed RNA polymerase subunit beta